jgi:geranylgeranyl pyrophosphate synthase
LGVQDAANSPAGGPDRSPADWGNKFSILASDLLLAKALQLAGHGGPSALGAMAAAISTACAGQIHENELAFNLDVDEHEHLRVIGMKTATICELPCRLGAELSGAQPSIVDALRRYGRDLGVAFQLTDDMLDLVGETTALGKSPGTDLRDGIYSLAVLQAARFDRRLRRILGRRDMSTQEIAEAVELVRLSQAIPATKEVAVQYAQRAAQALDVLPRGPARTTLRALIDYAIDRKIPRRLDLSAALD